ncbi:MAG: biopolymer transporter ExbD [Planctomyces sp.]|nr:biopolymer transporter ExbD [Planctomyces sp.]
MPLKTEPLEEPVLNLASMLDIVLLLLMFFMIGTQFKENEREYKIQLPMVADAKALSGQPDELIVNVSRDGVITLNTDKMTLPELETALAKAIENFPAQNVMIRGDGAGPYQAVMDVMATAKRAGVRNVSLAHKPKIDR